MNFLQIACSRGAVAEDRIAFHCFVIWQFTRGSTNELFVLLEGKFIKKWKLYFF
ncbi:MAG: hypothetical protein ACQEUT_08270 [Bacillota bacterium]